MNWIFCQNPDKRGSPLLKNPLRAEAVNNWVPYVKDQKERTMASKNEETRLKQKATLEAKLQKRLTLLAEKGLDEKTIARDVLVKELKANLKQTQVRLRAIAANDKRTADLAAMKAERLAKPKEETPKAKKAAPEPPPEAKAKKKKKKDEEAQPQQT
jgi:hypothetical protein